MDFDRYPPFHHTVAILWRGDAAARRDATPQNNRFSRVFEALAASCIEARPVVYDESTARGAALMPSSSTTFTQAGLDVALRLEPSSTNRHPVELHAAD
jgi:hypothetical protein